MEKQAKLVMMAMLVVLASAFYSVTALADWANPELLVSADDVKKNIDKPNWVVIDCRDLKDYAKGHIPGAISLGNRCKKALRDTTARVHRDITKYEKLFGKAGIGNDTHVVVYYDGMGTLTDATVAFWIMEYLGHDGKVHVLNGGLDAWRNAGNRLDNKPVKKDAKTFKANVVASRYASTDEIVKIAKGESKAQLIDSRTQKEHDGKDIRAIRGGHVPNTTINVSHVDTLAQAKDKKTGKMMATAYLDSAAVSKAFGSLDKNQRTAAYCQTGTRSTMTYLQMRLMGFKDPANWDDSWRVYGSNTDLPAADEQWFNFASLNKKIKKLEKKVAALEGKK
ncbi:sulfurtransferase [Kaarinaea lacus]